MPVSCFQMVHFFCYWTLSAAMSWTLGIKAFPFNRFLAIYIVPAVVWLATWHEGALVWSHWACSQIVAATACFYLAAQFSRLLNSGQGETGRQIGRGSQWHSYLYVDVFGPLQTS